MSYPTDTRPTQSARDDTVETGPETESESRPVLESILVENDDAPDECAIFPYEATDTELDRAWVSALEGSFTDLESMR